MMDFESLLERMTTAVCRGDPEAAAACFTPAGLYHDGFYGEIFERAPVLVKLGFADERILKAVKRWAE
jgi:hypothetical protein